MNLDLYKKYRGEIKTGDLIEWRSSSILGASIRAFTGKKVNHSGIAFVMDNYGNHDGNHIFTIEAEPDGIELNLLSAQISKFKGQVFWKPLKPQFDHLRNRGIDWALQQVGTPYDYKSLFANAISKVSADARKYFCSEFAFLYYVVSEMLPQFVYDYGMRAASKMDGGGRAIAPVPGDFGQYRLHIFDIAIAA